MPEVLDWRTAADPRPIVHRAARALSEGEVVAFPTDTVYALAASALIPDAVARLCASKKSSNGRPMTLAVRGAGEALDWVPAMSPLGRRLARRCWPGPVTLVFDGAEQGLVSRLSEAVRHRVCANGTIGMRSPAHRAILGALQFLPGPLVLTSANPTGAAPATTAGAVVEALGDDVGLVIDDGPTQFGRSSTVVRVNGSSWSVLREGPLSAADVGQQTACLTIFVCTGNTCRSPLAEGLFKRKLAERLGCTPDELPGRGFLVISAGLAAMMGGAAAEEAVEAAKTYGADLSGHVSRPLTPDLAAQADYLVAMTRSHLLTLTAGFPDHGTRPRLLSPAGEDVSDPIGCEQHVYRECAEQIWGCLDQLAAEITESV